MALLLIATVIFLVLASMLTDPQVKKISWVLAAVCGVAFAILIVLYVAGAAPVSWSWPLRS